MTQIARDTRVANSTERAFTSSTYISGSTQANYLLQITGGKAAIELYCKYSRVLQDARYLVPQ